MNPKIQRVKNEIVKTKTKLSESQIRLRELEELLVELENSEIINLFRSVEIAPEDLTNFIQAYKEQQNTTITRAAYQQEVTRYEDA